MEKKNKEKSPIFDTLPMPPNTNAFLQQQQEQKHYQPAVQQQNWNMHNEFVTPFSRLTITPNSSQNSTSSSSGNRQQGDIHSLDSIIVCFFADGTPYYNKMTKNALISFLKTTPNIRAGLLTKDNDTAQEILNAVPSQHRSRVIHKLVSNPPPLHNWNPTQYKLDIKLFSDERGIENIFWIDSDVIIYADLSKFLLNFVSQPADVFFYMVPDHVMGQTDFMNNWKTQHGFSPFVPQACVLGFRKSIIHQFFHIWQKNWQDWISDRPFSKYPDPNPHFRYAQS